MSEEWLKRIEEKHAGNRYLEFPNGCCAGSPCDVVKLARALDEIVEDAKAGVINRGLNSVQDAERTLKEVADDADD